MGGRVVYVCLSVPANVDRGAVDVNPKSVLR